MFRLCCIVCLCIFVFPVTVASAAISALQPSEIFVSQSITEVSQDLWSYEFSFRNTADSPIWQFGVYTSFLTETPRTATFPYSNSYALDHTNFIGGPYDARNVDPSLTHVTFMYYWPYSSDLALPVGASAVLSFTADRYDASPKLFFYETVESGYARQNGGSVAAYAYTGAIPEPTSLAIWSAIVLGGLGLAYRTRRKQTA